MTTETQEQIKWIEVEDHLPPFEQMVIVHRKGMLHESIISARLIEAWGKKFWVLFSPSYSGNINTYTYPIEQNVVMRWFKPPRLPNENI